LAKISQKLHRFQFCATNGGIYRNYRRIQICYIRFNGSQGSFHGNQIWANKIALLSVLSKKSRNFSHVGYSAIFAAGEFKYAIGIFNGAKGVAMAAKFGQK